MSFADQQTAETDSTDTTTDAMDITPEPVTGRYLSLQAAYSVVRDAIGAIDDFGMDDTDLPAVMWANAMQDALYEQDGCLGELQSEMTDYTTGDYKDTFGDTISTPHADLTDGERTELRGLFKESENHSESLADAEYNLPVVNGERLPLLVADMDAYEAGVEMLEAMLDEFDNDAGSTTGEVDEEFVEACENAGLDPDSVDAALEGYSVPSAGTLDDLEGTVEVFESAGDENALRTLLKLEKANKDRKGGVSLIESAIDAQDEATEEEADASDDEGADSTTSGLSDEEKEEIATTVATAVVEALDN